MDRTPRPNRTEAAQPVWRADLLESVAGAVGSFDRTHHHPAFTGWEPGHRQFVEALSADPLGWLAARLSNLDTLLVEANVDRGEVGADDAASLRDTVPEIIAVVDRLLHRVRAGELGRPRSDPIVLSARGGWL